MAGYSGGVVPSADSMQCLYISRTTNWLKWQQRLRLCPCISATKHVQACLISILHWYNHVCVHFLAYPPSTQIDLMVMTSLLTELCHCKIEHCILPTKWLSVDVHLSTLLNFMYIMCIYFCLMQPMKHTDFVCYLLCKYCLWTIFCEQSFFFVCDCNLVISAVQL